MTLWVTGLTHSLAFSHTALMSAQTHTQTRNENDAIILNVQTVPNQPMNKFIRPPMPVFKSLEEKQTHVKERLACALRIFGKYGYDEGVAGHITVRDPIDPKRFWVNPFGVAFSLMTASDLLLVDHKGSIVGGGKGERLPFRPANRQIYNRAAYCIHAAIHAARPDVDAAAHSHSIYGKAFNMTNQDVCVFYNDHALYPNFGGVVVAEEESANIVKYLGNTKALILQNHGILTVGHTVEEAVAWFIRLEKSCQTQLLADAAATGKDSSTIKISHEEAQFTHDQIGTPHAGWFSGTPYFDVIEAETGGAYKL
ncbi:hypothetical protein Clacol_002822 [Clathrus columnatus]|uniref:Class II aldolase/adducin N-terminal domain-containing protein n=1 Tax=Clathrus columnatus TaxID=1419009 RepID=A0AAV5A5W4_9AGAM|nr:hypothetical protein Clacol_002822 [Clathrus columnatus]